MVPWSFTGWKCKSLFKVTKPERVNKFETPVVGSLVSNAVPPRVPTALVLAG